MGYDLDLTFNEEDTNCVFWGRTLFQSKPIK